MPRVSILVLGLLVGSLTTASFSRPARANPSCDPATLIVGAGSGAPGERVEVELRGQVACEVAGFSIAVGHDPEKVAFVEARPGPFLVDHAGDDLELLAFPHNGEGFAALFAAFDLSFPLTVPPLPIPEETLLATLVYEVYSDVPAGTTVPLRNEHRTFGQPNPISNVYIEEDGTEIHPRLGSGSITVTSGPELPVFRRADANSDARVDIADPIFTLNHLFLAGPAPACDDAVDANDDGRRDISDAVYALSYLFMGGPAPPDPGPHVAGPDPTPDELGCGP
ncbi:MAG: hypothetical protein HY721_32915 [Planctomycetes bacterium]|nr:hypothetical protein [Planctomycetota bacterium]